MDVLARMRTDATLASILAAYTTPLLAAPWRINPRGASPEAVKLCADSLGIPVAGEDKDDPGPVRRRGVTWVEHVRMAALYLVFGHMPFEPVYEVRDGKAYLLALPERMPNTIIDIKTNDDGSLKSIVQEGRPGQKTSLNGGVEIPAERLLYYVHAREGATWQGRSLLRPAYSNWLLKLDTLRVNAIGIARFGAGTPVAEPIAGSNPTPAQIAEAQRLVSSWRVGETGGAVPVGFKPRILGIEGTLPDALPTLRYYDEQMARAALTSMLDLGSTANGSRALGSEFADVFERALNGVAQEMAATGTQLCERLVTFNFGENAAVPAVEPGDVGASSATIAASITSLIQTGAVTPDPALEAYVRDAYNLPPRVEPAVAPVPPVAVTAPPAPLRVAAAAAAPERTYREPTEAEQAAGVDPAQVDEQHDALIALGVTALAGIVAAWGAALAAGIVAALTGGGIAALAKLSITRTDRGRAAVRDLMVKAHQAGVEQVLAETRRAGADHGLTLADVPPDDGELDVQAEVLTEQAASGLAGAAGREALRLADADGGQDGDRAQETAEQVVETVTTDPSSPGGQQSPLVQQAVTRAMGGGRVMAMRKVMEATPELGWVVFASAIRDQGTCEPCAEHDGTVYPDLTAGRKDFPGGNYYACLGRRRCRCLLAMRPAAAPAPMAAQ